MSDQGAPGGQAPTGGTAQQGQAPAGSTTGPQGQAPAGNGQNGGQPGQAPGQNGGQQGQQQQGNQGTPDLSGITDPNLRAWVEAQARETREAREEAARYRTERNGFQQQIQQFQRQNETAEQQAQREQAEREAETQRLRDENRSLRVGQAFATAATAAHALDPGALLNLIGGPAKVELDDQGKPTNVDALITQARETYPWAFSRTSADAGGGAGQQTLSSGGMNDFIRGRR